MSGQQPLKDNGYSSFALESAGFCMDDGMHVTRATAWFASVIVANFALNYLFSRVTRMQPERAMVVSGAISSLLTVPGMMTLIRARQK